MEKQIKGELFTDFRPIRINDYKTPEELQNKIDEYFVYIKGEWHEEERGDNTILVYDREPEPPTVTGLALYLGFSTRQALLNYQHREDFKEIIEMAKLRVEGKYEKNLSGKYPNGSIFALKNLGWADNKNVNHTGLPEVPQLEANGKEGEDGIPPLSSDESQIG